MFKALKFAMSVALFVSVYVLMSVGVAHSQSQDDCEKTCDGVCYLGQCSGNQKPTDGEMQSFRLVFELGSIHERCKSASLFVNGVEFLLDDGKTLDDQIRIDLPRELRPGLITYEVYNVMVAFRGRSCGVISLKEIMPLRDVSCKAKIANWPLVPLEKKHLDMYIMLLGKRCSIIGSLK